MPATFAYRCLAVCSLLDCSDIWRTRGREVGVMTDLCSGSSCLYGRTCSPTGRKSIACRTPQRRAGWSRSWTGSLQISAEDPFRARFSAVAQERFSAWRRELEEKIRGGHLEPALESHLAKSRSLLPKLALIFHLAENGKKEEIPLIEAERAAQFCAYLESHARRVYGCVASRPLQLAARLGEKLRRGRLANGFRIGDVYLQGWPGLDTVERAREAIRVLVDSGWIRPSSDRMGGRGGASSEQYIVNPTI